MAAFYARYMHLLTVYPVPTKMVTSGTLFAAGDVIAQYVSDSSSSSNSNSNSNSNTSHGQNKSFLWNQDRTLKAAIWGGIIFAPIAHVWYNRILDRFIPGTSTRAVLTKVAFDQTLWGFSINSLYLTYAEIYINHGSLHDAEDSVKNKIWPLMKANWLLWPAVQLINFRFVPPPLQVPFINVVVLGWSAFMAMIATTPTQPIKHTEQENKIQLVK